MCNYVLEYDNYHFYKFFIRYNRMASNNEFIEQIAMYCWRAVQSYSHKGRTKTVEIYFLLLKTFCLT